MTEIGIKYDENKIDWTLVPWKEMEEVVKVLTHGAIKYSPDNWKKVDPERYRKALLRHIFSYIGGEVIDQDSGLNHMAHVICNALFLMWNDNLGDEVIDLSELIDENAL